MVTDPLLLLEEEEEEEKVQGNAEMLEEEVVEEVHQNPQEGSGQGPVSSHSHSLQ